MALGLVVALLAVTMPATAIAPISESSYAETRLWTFEHQDPAGSRAERGLSRTGIEGYQLSSWKPRRAVPFTRGGQQVALHGYFPFGQEATDSGADEIQLKFTGHERDKTGTGSRSELDYMHARHCSPVVGRFLSVDPAKSATTPHPQSWNRYTYGANGPINFVDPDGRAIETVWDVANVSIGTASLATNIVSGNVGGVIVDSVALALDLAATSVPGIPGGASASVKVARASRLFLRVARPQKVANATRGIRATRFRFGKNVVQLDRKGLTHILSRHHPQFWDGSVSKVQSFFADSSKIEDLTGIIGAVLQQNRNRMALGSDLRVVLRGTVDGIVYRVVVRRGRIVTAFPEGAA